MSWLPNLIDKMVPLWEANPAYQKYILLGILVLFLLGWLFGWPLYRKMRRINAYDDKMGSLQAEGSYAKQNIKKTLGKQPVVVAIESFARTHKVGQLRADRKLSFLDKFDGRFIKSHSMWEENIWPTLKDFFTDIRETGRPVHLRLDAHSTIAFACGALFDVKTGLALELEQSGDRGVETWTPVAGQGERSLPGVQIVTETVGQGPDVAIALSVTRAIGNDVKGFVSKSLPQVGRLFMIIIEGGPGQGKVIDGEHAAGIADAVVADLSDIRGTMKGGVIHLFASCPNSVMLALGRRSLPLGRIQLYEFDFQKERSGTYVPSMALGRVLEPV